MRVGASVSARAGSGGGAEHWLSVHDELLRALAHAISNRLATIVAAAGVLDVDEVPDARFLDSMRMDAERLEGLLQQMRQLPRRPREALEPMLFADALHGAQRLVEEHPLLRDRAIETVLVGDVMPVRAEPGALLHATAVALLAAARLGPGPLRAEFETVGDEVRLTVRHAEAATGAADPAVDADGEADVQAIDWLLAGSTGRALAVADGCAVLVPTLQASRRRPG